MALVGPTGRGGVANAPENHSGICICMCVYCGCVLVFIDSKNESYMHRNSAIITAPTADKLWKYAHSNQIWWFIWLDLWISTEFIDDQSNIYKHIYKPSKHTRFKKYGEKKNSFSEWLVTLALMIVTKIKKLIFKNVKLYLADRHCINCMPSPKKKHSAIPSTKFIGIATWNYFRNQS